MTLPQPFAGATSATGWAEGVPVAHEEIEALSKGVPGVWTITVHAPCKFINLNSRTHWAPKAQMTKAWRNAAHVAARNAGLPKGLARVHIVAHVIKPTSRAYDVHNLLPTLKAAIDGLVDHGLISDDSNQYLVGPDLRQGIKGDLGIVITITEIGGRNEPENPGI